MSETRRPNGCDCGGVGICRTDTDRLDWLTTSGHSLVHYGARNWEVPDYGVQDSPRAALDAGMDWDAANPEQAVTMPPAPSPDGGTTTEVDHV